MQFSKVKKFVLSERTPISLALAVTLIGGAFFVAEVAYLSRANADRIDDLTRLRRTELQIIRSDIKNVTDLANQINGKMDVLLWERKTKFETPKTKKK